jgi:hypothetical protein
MIEGVKTHWIKEFLIVLEKVLEAQMSKVGSHDPFVHI